MRREKGRLPWDELGAAPRHVDRGRRRGGPGGPGGGCGAVAVLAEAANLERAPGRRRQPEEVSRSIALCLS